MRQNSVRNKKKMTSWRCMFLSLKLNDYYWLDVLLMHFWCLIHSLTQRNRFQRTLYISALNHRPQPWNIIFQMGFISNLLNTSCKHKYKLKISHIFFGVKYFLKLRFTMSWRYILKIDHQKLFLKLYINI